MDMIVQLKQMNAYLMAQQAHLLTKVATASQLVTTSTVLGAPSGLGFTPSLDCRQNL